MVNKEVLYQKINIIEDNLKKLEELASLPEQDFLSKFYYIESAKYLLQISIEAMLDIANHIIARRNYGTPKTYAESFIILVEKGILPGDKKNTFVRMAKFRNRIVHLYHQVDDKEVHRIVKVSLDDFRDFINAVTTDL
ncbi:MAG: DUF86 domain-containing protein [Clostridia bacterium]|mgnify:CR=1 FL=1|nr:DUF86 domain-containing protein [Clostridia bacterium]